MKYITLIPAYDRDYKSKKDVLADFNANKDFLQCDCWGEQVCNKQDLQCFTEMTVNLRYKSNTQIATVKLTG